MREPGSTRHDDRVLRGLLAVLMLTILAISGFAVARNWAGDQPWRFVLIPIIAGVVSLFLASGRIQDGFALALSLLLGIVVVVIVTASFSGYLEGDWQTQIRAYPGIIFDALVWGEVTGTNRDLTAESLLSLLIWMISWLSIWILIRARSAWMALVAPWTLFLSTQFSVTHATPRWITIVLVAVSLMVVTLNRNDVEYGRWRRDGSDRHQSVPTTLATLGLLLSLLISGLVAASPEAWSQTVLQPFFEQSMDRLETLREDTGERLGQILGNGPANIAGHRYTDFDDGFSIGGAPGLTDEPEVMVWADTLHAPYLKARTYDSYTGRGWISSTAEEFVANSDSERQSPRLRYNPGWEIALSPMARNQRKALTLQVSPLNPNSDTVYTVETFLLADTPVIVQMSWMSVEHERLSLTIENLTGLPPDVQFLGSLLLQADLRGEATQFGPASTSASLQSAIDAEVQDLARRGITVTWDAAEQGIVQSMSVTGRLPVFDDVEAVFSTQPGGDYTSTSLSSLATADELESAGTDYPVWITGRYLQLGDTVTPRTIDLTKEIVGDETNPYRQARLIEEWLRTNITYDDKIDAPPPDHDLVDYVLFEHRYGYCEHYAAAMTVMLRSQGIPARVAVGYAPGERDDQSGAFLYLQSNAHAWVEAYFPGYGWIPFEPTSNRPLGEFGMESVDGATEAGELVPTVEVTTVPDIATPDLSSDNSGATPPGMPNEPNPLEPEIILPASRGLPSSLLPVAGTVLGIGALIGVGVLAWNRSLRGLSPAGSMMRRLQRVGAWLGISSEPTTTPREFARRFESGDSPVSKPARRITRAYEIETYADPGQQRGAVRDAVAAWNEIKSRIYWLIRHRGK